MSSGKLVLVTGITGFIAGHVAFAFLEAGFRVRGTVRGDKAIFLTETVKVPGLEFTRIDDMASSGEFSDALKGVDILVHVASPIPGRAPVDEMLTTAIDGTLNVLKQATVLGVKKIVVTSSMAAVMDRWGNATREEARSNADNPSFVYMSSKILSERAVWQFAREHPEVDITTILPSYVFGPYVKYFPYPSSPSKLGSNSYIYRLMTGQLPGPLVPPYCVDVRDVAKAHVNAALLPRPESRHDVEENRFLVSPWTYTRKDAITYLNKRRPDVKTAKLEDVAELPGVVSTVDTSRAREVLGIKEWIDIQTTVDDTIDDSKEVQKSWTAHPV
ncbi:NAD(P)-binding protein [Pluteus cervinus]|uniref:NAD(P)-binding protein n=1 Tax=Pluteus cervinus TaxID=181527 RepID=A0ACD3A7B6_9AGAR|nr:NAD(P)-binding protein [Pluteus cervinus]